MNEVDSSYIALACQELCRKNKVMRLLRALVEAEATIAGLGVGLVHV
ncbi:hypothetical protein [Desulforhopalus sp. 52FAK]